VEEKLGSGGPPDFLGELIEEVREFFRVLAHFTRHPIAFGREWSEGRLRAMNPLGFFGTAVGLQLGATAIVTHFKPADEVSQAARQLAPTYFWLLDLLSSQLPLARAVVLAAVVHGWLARRSRQPFRVSLGMVLYGTGWGAICHALTAPVSLLFPARVSMATALVIGPVSLVMLVLALVGVHRLRRWTSALAPMVLGGVLVLILSSVTSRLMVRSDSPKGNQQPVRALEKKGVLVPDPAGPAR
jgi:hypothetical protein